MTKRLWRMSILCLLFAGFAALSFAAPQVQPAQKYKLTLENGKIIEGEIVAVTATTISIKDATLGVIAIARENILKIEPPLEEKKPAAVTPPPAPRYADQPTAPAGGLGNIQFGFSLSGGMGNINGGDFNTYIRDWNAYAADYNDYWGGDYYTVDWKEMKWLTKFGGEVYVRFGKNFGVGLGVEFIKKTNPGTINYLYDDAWTNYYSGYYRTFEDHESSVYTISQTLSVTPITLSFYGFLPIGPQAEVYAKVGAGYYLGKLTADWTQESEYYYHDIWYWNSGVLWPPHYHEWGDGTYTENAETTCNTIGFHFGAGFNFNISSNIALFGEAFYRLANFTDWQGTLNWDYLGHDSWGWTNATNPSTLPGNSTTTADDSITGKLWYYDDIWDWLNQGRYGVYYLYGAGDEPEENDWTENVRPAEINLNGFTFKFGVKIFFGGR